MLTGYASMVATTILITTTLIAHADQIYKGPDHFKPGIDPNGMPFITITTAGPIGTPDDAGEIVGKVKYLTLKLAREYDIQKNQFTHVYLSYYFNNSDGTESDRGMKPDQRLNINLLDRNGNPVVRDLALGGSPAPRGYCHNTDYFVPPTEASPFGWKSDFDLVGKDIQSIETTITGFGGYQGPC